MNETRIAEIRPTDDIQKSLQRKWHEQDKRDLAFHETMAEMHTKSAQRLRERITHWEEES